MIGSSSIRVDQHGDNAKKGAVRHAFRHSGPRSSPLHGASRGAFANVKPLARRVAKPVFSRFLYRYRNLVERFFNKLKHDRAIATGYETHATNFLATIKLAATRIWLRAYVSVT